MKPPESDGDGSADRVLAPPWHTGALIALMVAVAVTGATPFGHGVAALPALGSGKSRITTIYVPMLVMQWALLVYVCRFGRSRSALLPLLGRSWTTVGRALTDVALAIFGFSSIEASEFLFDGAFDDVKTNAAVSRILPSTSSEVLVWALVAVSVGFCEEVVYRGYLQTQLQAAGRSTFLALVLQALLFGVAHGEQGWVTAARFVAYGLGLGALAMWRQSLRPGILCHIGVDLVSGFLRIR